MFKTVKISIDLMGGANAPNCIIEGLNNVCSTDQEVTFILYGREKEVRSKLQKASNLQGRYTLIDCNDVVSDDEQPVKALKTGKESSMCKAIEAVRDNKVDACISSGNTGALMVMTKMKLGMLPGIKRPAIVSIYPNLNQGSVMLDLGANAECDPYTLQQFAVMGCCYAHIMLKKSNPSVGILNVGIEEYKGRDIDKKTFELLKNSNLNFHGFIEGDDLAKGSVDVVVTDGFTGNVVLKTSEGVAKTCQDYIKYAFNSSLMAKLGALLARLALKKTFKKIDPRNYNGAMFIGINGIVIKSHGSSDAFAFSNAVYSAIKLARQGINADISNTFETYYSDELRPTLVSKIKYKLGLK